jgi:hypothetical protein
MTSSPVVSVVMPARDGERFLPEALESIRAQSLGDFELIAVDDGSRDGTRELLERAARHDPRIRVVGGSGGPVAALNAGCWLARGRYLARMDADDVCHPQRLARQVRFLEARPEVVAVGGAIELADSGSRPLQVVVLPVRDAAIRRRLLSRNALAHPAVTMRTEAWRRAGGYRERFHPADDYDLWLRLAELGALANLRAVVLRYRLHANQTSLALLEQQALGALAARLCATWRRDGRAEPAAAALPGRFSATELIDLGLPRRRVEAALVEQHVLWAETLALSPELAATAQALYAAAASRSAGAKAVASRGVWLQAKLASQRGDLVTAARELLRCAALDPGLVVARLLGRAGGWTQALASRWH